MMKQCSWIPARKHLGLGLALVLVVALVTLLFNFLGTLSCCVLVAMMSGTAKPRRWHAVLISLVFPAVLLSFAPIPKIGLPWHETVLLAILCFGVFWATYLLTRALMCLETSDGVAPGKRPRWPAELREKPAHPQAAEPAVVPRGRSCGPDVDELQGTWSWQASAVEGQPCEKIIEVAHNQLALRITDLRGQVRVLSKGDVRVEQWGSLKILKVLAPVSAGPAGSAESPGPLWTWVYQLVGQTLKVAVNFDGTAEGREPAIETYVKTRGPTGAGFPISRPGERIATALESASAAVMSERNSGLR